MALSSFPDRLRSRRRAPITDAGRDTVRRLFAALLAGVAAIITTLVLADALSGWALLIAAGALLALPGTLYGWGLLETVAPLPDVYTPPVTGADLLAEVSTARISLPGHELALAGAVGVYRVGVHSVRALAESEVATTAVPQVRA